MLTNMRMRPKGPAFTSNTRKVMKKAVGGVKNYAKNVMGGARIASSAVKRAANKIF